MQVTCSECGQSFERKPSQVAKYTNKFCSRKCKAALQHRDPDAAGIGARLRSTIPCVVCGSPAIRTPATVRARTFCSRECAKTTLFPRGESHYMWKGGTSPYAPEYNRNKRGKIRKRDGHRCRSCGNAGTKKHRLEIHHKDGDKANNDDSNLITLCKVCHDGVHRGSVKCP